MSLIDDALRRVQDPLAAKELPATLPQAPNPTPSPAPQKKDRPAHSWPLTPSAKKPAEKPAEKQPRTRFLTLAVILLVAGAAFSWVANRVWLKPAPWPANPATQQRKPNIKAGQTPLPELEEAVDPAKMYQLTGVVVGVGEPYAMISGRIIAKGDVIGQATVIEIAESVVTLQLPDKTQIVLKVPR